MAKKPPSRNDSRIHAMHHKEKQKNIVGVR